MSSFPTEDKNQIVCFWGITHCQTLPLSAWSLMCSRFPKLKTCTTLILSNWHLTKLTRDLESEIPKWNRPQVFSVWYAHMYAYFLCFITILQMYSDVVLLTCSLQVHLRHVFGEFTGAGHCFTLPCDVGHCVPATCAITVDEVRVRRLHVHHLSMTSALITPARGRRGRCQTANKSPPVTRGRRYHCVPLAFYISRINVRQEYHNAELWGWTMQSEWAERGHFRSTSTTRMADSCETFNKKKNGC